jgi:hypothetical protein
MSGSEGPPSSSSVIESASATCARIPLVRRPPRRLRTRRRPLYNLAATLASVPAGRIGDRFGMVRVLAVGIAFFAFAYVGFAAAGGAFPSLRSASSPPA